MPLTFLLLVLWLLLASNEDVESPFELKPTVLMLLRLPFVMIGAVQLLLIVERLLLFVSMVNNGNNVRHSITWLRRKSYGPLCSESIRSEACKWLLIVLLLLLPLLW